MKKLFVCAAIVAVSCSFSQNASAQSILSKLKSVASTVAKTDSTTNALSGIVSNLLGTSEVSETDLVGTWSYSQPCVVFESSNVISKVGTSVVSQKVETTLNKQLTKLGFKAGSVIMTFAEDGNGSIQYAGKTIPCTWSVNESQLTLTILTKSVAMNVKQSTSGLQLAMNADKLKTLLTAITDKASAVNSSIGTVTTLLKSVDGLYLGLQFAAKTSE